MKKRNYHIRTLSMLLAFAVLLLTLSACGDTVDESSYDDPSESSYAFSEPDDTSSDGSSAGEESLPDDSSDAVSDDGSLPDESDDVSVPDDEPPAPEINEQGAFRISSIDDFTDENGSRSYLVYAPYTDKYTIEGSDGIKKIEIYQDGEKLKSGRSSLSVSLTADEVYTLTVTTEDAEADFKITTVAENHVVTLPYDVASPIDTSGFDVNGSDPLVPAEVNYVHRQGGTYIYSNNPEQFGQQHVGKAFMRNTGLIGDVYVTFEHANYSNSNVYLGYQLKNETDHDVYITVTNVGYQWIGTWFGQLAWYAFYNTSFELPDDYFTTSGSISAKYASLDYAYREYDPRVFQPTTYRLPAGEYIWVIGGTSADAYRNINVDNSANRQVYHIKCANGNVKFTVTGGEVTGTMYCYSDISQIESDPPALGYVADGYAQQYSGIAHHHGVIDNYMTWTFDDSNKGMLPVTYTNYYADNLPAKTTPYAAYNSTAHTTSSTTTWMTHLNPQNNHSAVGMDLVEFIWHDKNGNDIVIDNHHADGGGTPANTANWMIEYQDHFTFVNQGDTERTVTLHLRDHGTLAILVRDSASGEVLEAAYTAGLGESNVFSNYTYEITIPAHSIKQITLDYLLVACSYGSVIHAVALK